MLINVDYFYAPKNNSRGGLQTAQVSMLDRTLHLIETPSLWLGGSGFAAIRTLSDRGKRCQDAQHDMVRYCTSSKKAGYRSRGR